MKKTAEHNNDLVFVGFGWEKADPSRILQSFVREHFRVHYITHGTGYLEVSGERYRLTEGCGFVIYPGVASNYYPDKDDPWEYFWLGARGDFLHNLIRQTRLSRDMPLFQITNSRDDARMNFVHLYTSLLHPALLDHPTWYYLHALFRNLSPIIRTRHSQTYYFEKCLRFVHENYMHDIHIGDIAASLSIDRTYLYKLFKHNLGCSPQTYLINHRISKACDLLLSTAQSISDIAYSVGFNDLSDFSKQFHKRKGVSPTQFRETSKEKNHYQNGIYF